VYTIIKDIFSVYIQYSVQFDKYYVGYTNHVEERLVQHNAGRTPSAKPNRPWALVYTEVSHSKTEAIKREHDIKRKKSKTLELNI